MKIREKQSRPPGDENIVPMINIVFLLLIFFLLAGTLTPRPPFEMEPVITTLKPPSDPPTDGLYVAMDGQIHFRGQTVALEELTAMFAPAGGGEPAPQELVVDRNLKGEQLMPVLDALARAGIEKVRLVTHRSTE
ncbi:MAG: ExbD/TolR family protein [Hyphomicrobiales bacterium]